MARILVANDNLDLLDCCRAILETDGHEVEAVADGRKAIWLARNWQPDLIVIDWVMPDMDGLTAIALLRADPATAKLPILLMSGTEGADEVAAHAGADAFLRKPFQSDELLAEVARLLGIIDRMVETRGEGST
jgi:CheY-like chemotaxis protein